MGTFLIVVVLLLLVFVASGMSASAKEAGEVVYNSCPPHKWTYKEAKDPITHELYSQMVCEKCGHPPGHY